MKSRKTKNSAFFYKYQNELLFILMGMVTGLLILTIVLTSIILIKF